MDSRATNTLCLLVLSGGLDRLVAAVNLAASAQALGRKVILFLSWEPLLRLARGTLDEAPLPESLGETAQGAREILAKYPSLVEMLAGLRQGGMKLYACSNTLQVLGISQDELTGKVDGVSGAAALLSMAENAQILCL